MDNPMNGDIIEGEKGFETCDLYLAAFFSATGCKMNTAYRARASNRVYFVYEKTPILMDLRLSYFSREAKVSAATYADNIKSLKSLCHNIVIGAQT